MTAVNRNQAESIITGGSLPRNSTNRQGVERGETEGSNGRGNLMGNSTSLRRGWVVASRNAWREKKTWARKRGENRKEREREREKRNQKWEKICLAERGSRGSFSSRFVNMNFLWGVARKIYRPGCHVTDFQFPARESLAVFREREKGREEDREKAKLGKVARHYGDRRCSDCRRLRRCEMHADSVFFKEKQGNAEMSFWYQRYFWYASCYLSFNISYEFFMHREILV